MFWTLVMRLWDNLWERLSRWMIVGLHLLCRSYFLPLKKKCSEGSSAAPCAVRDESVAGGS